MLSEPYGIFSFFAHILAITSGSTDGRAGGGVTAKIEDRKKAERNPICLKISGSFRVRGCNKRTSQFLYQWCHHQNKCLPLYKLHY